MFDIGTTSHMFHLNYKLKMSNETYIPSRYLVRGLSIDTPRILGISTAEPYIWLTLLSENPNEASAKWPMLIQKKDSFSIWDIYSTLRENFAENFYIDGALPFLTPIRVT